MTTVVGGKRLRLIKQGFAETVRQALDDLDWFDPGRKHKPIRFTTEEAPRSEEVLPNLVAVSTEDVVGEEIELGSGLEENRWDFYVDIYAENEALGLELAGDVRDVLRGKIPSIGRGIPHVDVLDYRLATPTHLFYVQIEDVDMVRPKVAGPAKSSIHIVACTVVDTYDSETD